MSLRDLAYQPEAPARASPALRVGMQTAHGHVEW